MSLSDIAILGIKGAHYRCAVRRNSKNEAKNLMQNTYMTEKSGKL